MIFELQRLNADGKTWDTLEEGSRAVIGARLSRFRNLFKHLKFQMRIKPLQDRP